jgi:hypothetical protein
MRRSCGDAAVGRVDIQITSTMSAASQTKLVKFSMVFS